MNRPAVLPHLPQRRPLASDRDPLRLRLRPEEPVRTRPARRSRSGRRARSSRRPVRRRR